MSVTVLMFAVLLSAAAPVAVENQNACWRDSRTSGPTEWGRYDYHLVNRCDQTIYVWDAMVLWRDDGTEERWSCGHGTDDPDEIERSGCMPLKVRPGETASYATRSGKRYLFFACYADNATCNELGKKWADSIHGLPRSFDPGEVARIMGNSVRSE
jgi:hypothetical protein